jgi:hypothetical protein
MSGTLGSFGNSSYEGFGGEGSEIDTHNWEFKLLCRLITLHPAFQGLPKYRLGLRRKVLDRCQ